ncbi:hypothetical protein GCM10011534_02140 [Pseudooceanicola nanhaiensis]|uniref:Uncharacterized protein n=2 Tax=Pseudooceanicola nanhaiensis TaxID=375761 RepID=A0A917SJG7_9RHOB|nr:hypothetical protein GCM10011534_02140 [Pseudooceanicola nanhaiensis]
MAMPRSITGVQADREAEILDMLKALSPKDLCDLARRLDRSTMTPAVLSWISAQRSVDLGTAMSLFMNAQPDSFNHLEKDAVPEPYRRLCAALDALCQRINCGYYLPDPQRPLDKVRDFVRWMGDQEADARSRRKGRWVFNPVTVAPMISDIRFDARRHKAKPARGERPGLFRKVFSSQSA